MNADGASTVDPDGNLREQLARVDDVCDRFETAWSAGRMPGLEAFLADNGDLPHDVLLRELLYVELSYRRRHDCCFPAIGEYLARFPEDVLLVKEVHATLCSELTPPTEQPLAADSMKHSRFRVVSLHDQGGLGRVWIATDMELKRQVALKDLKDCYAGVPQLRKRFVAEAEITAKLEHPGIVPVYGFGQSEDGRPYYAMRFIRGRSLASAVERLYGRADRARVSAGKRVEFVQLLRRFIDVCHAIEFAHSQGIVHRDLKPANIMLGEFGETLVVDWGLAKQEASPAAPAKQASEVAGHAMENDRSGDATWANQLGATQPGTTVGTPQYMSPEQAAGQVQHIGKVSDIYGLGATFFFVLTGQAPFAARKQDGGSLEDAVSQLLERVKRGDRPHPHQVNPGVPRALSAVCDKAMAVERSDRYAEVRAMREDIERWLANELVSVYQEPFFERIYRWTRRHRTGVQAAVIVLLLTAIVSLVAAWRLNKQRNITEAARQQAETLAQSNQVLATSESHARNQAETQLAQARRNAYAAQLARIAPLTLGNDPADAYDLLADQNRCPFELRDFAWAHLHRWCRQDVFRIWRAHASEILCARVDRAGEKVYSLAADGSLRVWNLRENRLIEERAAPMHLTCAAISAADVAAVARADGVVQLWALTHERGLRKDEPLDQEFVTVEMPARAAGGRVTAIAFSSDSGTLAAVWQVGATALPQVGVWDTKTLRLLADWTAPFPVRRVAVSPCGDQVGLGGSIKSADELEVPAVVVWDRDRRAELWRYPAADASSDLPEGVLPAVVAVTAMSYSVDGAKLLYTTNCGALMWLNAATGAPLSYRDWVHHGTISALAIGQQKFATAGPASSVREGVHRPDVPVAVWRVDGKTGLVDEKFARDDLAGLVGDIATMQLSPSEAFLAVASRGGGLAVFDMRSEWTRSVLHAPDDSALSAVHVCFGDQGRILSAVMGRSEQAGEGTRLERIERWNLLYGTHAEPQPIDDAATMFVADDGTFVSSIARHASETQSLAVRELATQKELGRLNVPVGAVVAGVSLAAKRAAIFTAQCRWEIVDLVNGVTVCGWDTAVGVRGVQPAPPTVPLCRFSPLGDQLAYVAGPASADVVLHDARTGARITSLSLAEPGVSCLAFSPHSGLLAIASVVREVWGTRTHTWRFRPPRLTLWNTRSNVALVCPHGHDGTIHSMSFSPDGRTLATAADDVKVRLWETESGLELLSLQPVSSKDAMSVAFKPDGCTLAIALWNGNVELWHATSRERIARHEVELVVERLSDTDVLTDAMIAQFAADTAPSSGVEVARHTAADVDALTVLGQLSWHLSSASLAAEGEDTPATRLRARQAREYAELALAAQPDSQRIGMALAAAQCLCGQSALARTTLDKTRALATTTGSTLIPEIGALQAVLELQSGHTDRAMQLHQELQQVLRTPSHDLSAHRVDQLRQLRDMLQRRINTAREAGA